MATGAGEQRPLGLDISQAVCDRASRLAKTMFGALDAQVVLTRDGEIWCSRERREDVRRTRDRGVEIVLAEGRLLWIEDARKDERFAGLPPVVGPPHLRFYVGAPIRLADGSSTPGWRRGWATWRSSSPTIGSGPRPHARGRRACASGTRCAPPWRR